MRHFLLVSFFLFCIFSCSNDPIGKAEVPDSNLYVTPGSDTNMELAMSKAKKTFDEFDAAFRQNKYDSGSCAVKLKFGAKNNLENVSTEYIWASSITNEDGDYYGVMDQPHFTTEVKGGEKVKIDPDKVVDWMYAENDTLRGGYTIRVTRNKMSAQQRAHFDATYIYKVVN